MHHEKFLQQQGVLSMKTYLKRYLHHADFSIAFVYLVLVVFGLVMIYSSSFYWAVERYDWAPDHFFQQQKTNLFLAIPVFFIMSLFPYKHFKNKFVMISMVSVMFLLLILVHFIGSGGAAGSQSWLYIGPLNLQPSEVAKIVLVLYFSSLFAKKIQKGTLNDLTNSIYPPIIIMAAAVGSIMLETDVGNSMIITFVCITVIVASGVQFRVFSKLLGLIISAFLIIGILLYFFRDTIITPRRLGRLEAFFNPFAYEESFGYQIVNGYLAIGSGGLTGLGLGNSNQKYGYLPEPHTDFIMAVIAEELGIIGVVIILAGIFFLVFKGLSIALTGRDPHGRMIAAGIASIFGFQTFVNLGGMLGIIPLTGVPLPFISYGGTALILFSAALGILMNVSMFARYEKSKK